MTTAGQARNFFPALRVFIFGQEVTEDVLSASVTWNDERAPNTAEIVLANLGRTTDGNTIGADREDRYIINNADINALYDEVNLTDLKMPETAAVIADAAFANEILLFADTFSAKGASTAESLRQQASTVVNRAAAVYYYESQTTVDEINRRIAERLTKVIKDPVKLDVVRTKQRERVRIEVPDVRVSGQLKIQTSRDVAALRGDANRYPFQVGDCIFHSNDPVRVFFRDPRNTRAWYHMFAGFVSDWVDDVDENNTKTVTIRCEDVSRALRYARFTTNPGLIDITTAGTAIDAQVRTFYNDNFQRLSLAEFIFTLIFGSDAAGTTDRLGAGDQPLSAVPNITGVSDLKLVRSGARPSVTAKLKNDGSGLFDFDRSLILVLGSDESVSVVESGLLKQREKHLDDLAVYQAIVDHQVRVADLEGMLVSAERAPGRQPIPRDKITPKDSTTENPTIEAVITTIGTRPDLYPVDGGRLIMLVPSRFVTGASASADILFKDFTQGVETKTAWLSRLSKIYDVLERVEFSFYVNGRGDLIAEMPLRDFAPHHFGDKGHTVNSIDLTRVLRDDKLVKTLLQPSETTGEFGPHYNIARKDTIRWSKSFSDEKVRTLVTCSPWVIPGLQATGQTDGFKAPQRVLLRSLVPQFGVRAEAVEPSILVGSDDAAEIYCQLQINRINADARQANVECLPQLRIGPNRPLLFTERNFIGTVRQVTHGIVWNSDISMSLQTNWTRGWAGQTSDGRPLYEFMGGYEANFINYALLLQKETPAGNTVQPSGGGEVQGDVEEGATV